MTCEYVVCYEERIRNKGKDVLVLIVTEVFIWCCNIHKSIVMSFIEVCRLSYLLHLKTTIIIILNGRDKGIRWSKRNGDCFSNVSFPFHVVGLVWYIVCERRYRLDNVTYIPQHRCILLCNVIRYNCLLWLPTKRAYTKHDHRKWMYEDNDVCMSNKNKWSEEVRRSVDERLWDMDMNTTT